MRSSHRRPSPTTRPPTTPGRANTLAGPGGRPSPPGAVGVRRLLVPWSPLSPASPCSTHLLPRPQRQCRSPSRPPPRLPHLLTWLSGPLRRIHRASLRRTVGFCLPRAGSVASTEPSPFPPLARLRLTPQPFLRRTASARARAAAPPRSIRRTPVPPGRQYKLRDRGARPILTIAPRAAGAWAQRTRSCGMK